MPPTCVLHCFFTLTLSVRHAALANDLQPAAEWRTYLVIHNSVFVQLSAGVMSFLQ